MISLKEKLDARFIPEPNSGCFLWLGTVDRYGYGLFQVRGVTSTLAHRTAYELEHGCIPGGLGLDHKCRVRCCVNPQHLEPVTDQENIRRAQPFKVRKTHCKRGHLLSEENLYRTPKGRQCRRCVIERARRIHAEKKGQMS